MVVLDQLIAEENVPESDPSRHPDSEVPDGFEFLNETPSLAVELCQPPPTTRRRLLPGILGSTLFVAVVVAAALAFRAEQAPPETSPPTSTWTPLPSHSSVPTTGPSSSTPQPSQPPKFSGGGTAAQILGELAVKGRAPTTGYERERFGPDWVDVDRNGCDTRNDVLRRDLLQTVTDPDDSCIVESGSLLDPYSGGSVDFTRGWETSFEVQVDHVVALNNAWQTGAQYWKARKRLAFANDPLNLLAVDGDLNIQKSDGDAATWLPPNGPYRCQYVARQIAVKAKYGLWLTQPEHDAMARILTACPDQDLPVISHR